MLIDPKLTSVHVIQTLEAAGAKVIEGEEPCVLAKACKNPVELAGRPGRAAPRRRCGLPLPVLARS